jgi:hypothetical protein
LGIKSSSFWVWISIFRIGCCYSFFWIQKMYFFWFRIFLLVKFYMSCLYLWL